MNVIEQELIIMTLMYLLQMPRSIKEDRSEYFRPIQGNLRSVFTTLESVQFTARKLVKKGKGKIVFLSSMAGIITTPYIGPYAATKHAIEGMALTLKDELKEYGVQVATINPGAYNTGFNDRAAEEKWEWFDEEKNFTRAEGMKKQEKGLKNQFDPEDMIER
ncbi:SDR family NAD(P)-dependent oxidoreductase [Peribacillus sp. NPDC096448]|uniref:SDR family NAD(P)-dependent oxidoreductase n=1 Tax=Peribacillus sp. NPDC096448 TaxID=3364395 RepID=UPI00382D7D2D